MADRISFGLRDSAGAPLLGATPAFVQYRTTAGVPRTPPAITEIGGGQYGFSPTDADETAGVAFLVDAGASASPRRFSGAIHTPSLPFLVVHLEDAAGALWTGAAPTVGIWRDFSGNARTPPTVLAPGGTTYLFALVPSGADLALDVAFRIDVPAGAEPSTGFTGSIEEVVVSSGSPWEAPSPGPLLNAAVDVAAFLDTKIAGGVVLTLGTNLFRGRMREQDRTPSPAVFSLNTGGPEPELYFGGRRTALYRPTVQVMVRGAAGDDQVGEQIARDLLAWLTMRVVSTYVTWKARDSQPVFLGVDKDQHGLWVLNLECIYQATLD